MKGLLSVFITLSLFVISGCTSNSTPRPDLPTVTTEQAKTQPQQYKGTKVYWGGTILNVKNHKDYALIEVLRYPFSDSEPNDQKKAQGRFMVKVSDFIDPAEYKSPSRIAVTGTLQGIQSGKVDSYPYTYPVVVADKVQFWKGQKVNIIRDPYWWDHPYYRPWPYPYWRGHW